MSISCGIRTKVSENGSVRADTEAVVRTERNRDHRSRSVPGPHTYADQLFAKAQYRVCDGILKREKQSDDFRQARKFEVQVWKQAFLGKRYFVDTVGKNKKRIEEYIKNQVQQDQIADQMSLKEFVDPFTGSKNTKA